MQTKHGLPTDADEESGYSLMPPHDFDRYGAIYNDIVKSCQYCFMTISPKPNPVYTYDDFIKMWFCDFAKYIKENDVNKFLLVIELNKKALIHFHFLVKFDTIRKKYTFMKYVNRWFHLAVIEPIYNYEPKHGYVYLLKQYDMVLGVLEKSPIYDNHEIIENDDKTFAMMKITSKVLTKSEVIRKLITEYDIR